MRGWFRRHRILGGLIGIFLALAAVETVAVVMFFQSFVPLPSF